MWFGLTLESNRNWFNFVALAPLAKVPKKLYFAPSDFLQRTSIFFWKTVSNQEPVFATTFFNPLTYTSHAHPYLCQPTTAFLVYSWSEVSPYIILAQIRLKKTTCGQNAKFPLPELYIKNVSNMYIYNKYKYMEIFCKTHYCVTVEPCT